MADLAGVPIDDLLVATGERPGTSELAGVDLTDLLSHGRQTHAEQRRDPTIFEELGRGTGAGIQQTQAGLYGFAMLLGQLTGSDVLKDYGTEGATRNLLESELSPPTVGSLDDVGGVNDFFHFAAGGLGQALPSIAMAMTGGGLTAAVARKAAMARIRQTVIQGARGILARESPGVTAQFSDAAIRNVLRNPSVHRMLAQATQRGGLVGATAANFPVEAGHSAFELDQRGIAAPFTALGVGAAVASLDAAPNVRLLGRLFPGVEQTVSKGFVRDLAATMGTQALLEGSTEGAQEMIAMAALAYHDPTFDPTSPDSLMRVADAAAIGALMGVATGGAGEAASQLIHRPRNAVNFVREGGARLRAGIERTAFGTIRAFDPAVPGATDPDAAVPGFAETVSGVGRQISDMFTNAASTLRVKAAEGVDAVQADMAGSPSESINAAVEASEGELLKRLQPEIERIGGRVRDQLTKIREAAKQMAEGQRAEYIKTKTSALLEQADAFIRDRVARASAAVEAKLADKFDTQNLPDEDKFGFEDDEDTGKDLVRDFETFEELPKHVIGQTIRQRFRNGGNGQTDPVPIRSRGENAIPFKSRAAAEKASAEVYEAFPDVHPEAFSVIERPEGFYVGIFDATGAEAIFEQQRLNDTLTKSAALARGKDIRKNPRVIQVRRPGTTEVTRMDLPTITFGGQDVQERAGGQIDQDQRKRALQGMDEALARLIASGYEIVGGMDALADRHIIPGLTVAEARRQTSFEADPSEVSSALESPTARGELEGIDRLLGFDTEKAIQALEKRLEQNAAETNPAGPLPSNDPFQTQTVEERNRETEDQQAFASTRARVTPSQVNPIPRAPGNRNVRVGLLSASQELRDRVAKLVSDVAKATGLSDQQFFIVDRKGAEALLASKEFTPQQKAVILQTIANDENGKIMGSVMHGGPLAKKRVIYLSEKMMSQNSSKQMLRTLFHELGHVVQRVLFDELPFPIRMRMHREWADSGTQLDFNEWMADQLVAWAVRDRKPRNAIERFFEKVREVLYKLFNSLQQEFQLSTTFEEFMKGVTGVASADMNLNDWGEALLAQRFRDQGIASKPGKIIVDVESQNLDTEVKSNVIQAAGRFRKGKIQDELDRAEAKLEELYKDHDALVQQLEDLEAKNRDAILDGDEVGIARTRKQAQPLDDKLDGLNELIDEAEDELDELRAYYGVAYTKATIDWWANSENPGEGMPEDFDAENLTFAQAQAMMRGQLSQMKQRVGQQFPQAMRAAESMWRTMQGIHDQWTSSLNGALRRQGIPVFDEIAEMFNKTPGKALNMPTYFADLQRNRAIFFKQAHEILDGKPQAEIDAAMQELINLNGRQGTHTNPIAIQMRALLDRLEAYMISKGLPLHHVDNYFPKVWDAEKIKANEAQLRADMTAEGISTVDQDKVFDHMLTHDGSEADFQLNMRGNSQLSGVPTASFLKARNKVLGRTTFDKYLSTDAPRVMERYINAAVKRAEFNERLGDDWRVAKNRQSVGWSPRLRLDEYIDRAKQQGATPEQIKLLENGIEALLGRYGRNFPDQARRTMAWIMTYQNLRLLGFSQLSSLPDLVGPGMRTGDYKRAFEVMRDQFKQITDNASNLNEAGRVWGIISDSLNQHVLTEHYDTHWFPERARKLNDFFFRAIGMEKLNNFVRGAALAVGMDFIERRANAAASDPNAVRDLAELGLTPQDVAAWVANGRQTYGASSYQAHAATASDEKVSAALVQFVNEANMRPNPSSRPLMASHPALMLLWHLKSFMFAFYDVFIRRMILNAERAGTPWQKAYVVAVPAAMMLALTAAGLELRELIQYKIWGNEGRTERMSGDEYLWELIQRSGLFGPSQLLVDFEEAGERGQAGVVALAGPSLQQLNELVNAPASTSIPKAIPIVSQIPQARDWLRGD